MILITIPFVLCAHEDNGEENNQVQVNQEAFLTEKEEKQVTELYIERMRLIELIETAQWIKSWAKNRLKKALSEDPKTIFEDLPPLNELKSHAFFYGIEIETENKIEFLLGLFRGLREQFNLVTITFTLDSNVKQKRVAAVNRVLMNHRGNEIYYKALVGGDLGYSAEGLYIHIAPRGYIYIYIKKNSKCSTNEKFREDLKEAALTK